MKIIKTKEVIERTSLSRTAINKLRHKGRFPAAVSIDERRIGFVESEVEDWIRERIEQRDRATA